MHNFLLFEVEVLGQVIKGRVLALFWAPPTPEINVWLWSH